jgi:2-(1,2-epoxy-1,2-dihydrophenyl)acetyl-CoA isomerase
MLPRLIGLARSFELASTGRRVPAAEAREIGLISKTVTRETLDRETESLISYYRHAPTRAIGAMKHALNQSMHSNLPQMLENERESQEMLFGTCDVKEGISAFLEKRKPDFQGI